MVGVVKGKLKRKEKEEGKTPTGTVAISFVDRLISFPGKSYWKVDGLGKRRFGWKIAKKSFNAMQTGHFFG